MTRNDDIIGMEPFPEEYRRTFQQDGSLVDFFQASPLHGVELEIKRSRDTKDIEASGADGLNPWK